MIKRSGDKVSLMDKDILIAEATPGKISLSTPSFVSFDEAAAASKNYEGFKHHVFPTCFVCGPARVDDALRIFAAKPEGKNFVAAPWMPDASLAQKGFVKEEFHWAALDCPGYFAIGHAPQKSVLGKMTATVSAPVRPNEKCVVIGWSIKNDGRKHYVGTGLFSENGALSAIAHAVWIDID